jgi:hypothetical protein
MVTVALDVPIANFRGIFKKQYIIRMPTTAPPTPARSWPNAVNVVSSTLYEPKFFWRKLEQGAGEQTIAHFLRMYRNPKTPPLAKKNIPYGKNR